MTTIASSAPTIDVHAHLLLPEVEEAVAGHPGLAEARALDARRNGPAALAVNGPMVGARVPKLTDAAVRLAAMDAQGVDIQLVSPSPSHYRSLGRAPTGREGLPAGQRGHRRTLCEGSRPPATAWAWSRSSIPTSWSACSTTPWTRG